MLLRYVHDFLYLLICFWCMYISYLQEKKTPTIERNLLFALTTVCKDLFENWTWFQNLWDSRYRRTTKSSVKTRPHIPVEGTNQTYFETSHYFPCYNAITNFLEPNILLKSAKLELSSSHQKSNEKIFSARKASGKVYIFSDTRRPERVNWTKRFSFSLRDEIT